MSLRPGTAGARRLFEKQDPIEYEEMLAKYSSAVQLVAAAAKKDELPALDSWLHENFAKEDGEGKIHLNLKNLQKIVEWKLCRGKDRPMLRGLVKENSDKAVRDAFAASMNALDQGDWLSAIKELATLRGVGPATASAVLAPLKKGRELCPFMADEVLEAVTGKKREYTLKAYESMQSILMAKTKELNGRCASGRKWSVQEVATAIWVAGVLSLYKGQASDETAASTSSICSKKQRGKKNSAPRSTNATASTTTTKRKRTKL